MCLKRKTVTSIADTGASDTLGSMRDFENSAIGSLSQYVELPIWLTFDHKDQKPNYKHSLKSNERSLCSLPIPYERVNVLYEFSI